jgi:hypothetical protein
MTGQAGMIDAAIFEGLQTKIDEDSAFRDVRLSPPRDGAGHTDGAAGTQGHHPSAREEQYARSPTLKKPALTRRRRPQHLLCPRAGAFDDRCRA